MDSSQVLNSHELILQRKAIDKREVSCIDCHWQVQVRGLRKHQQSNSCVAMQRTKAMRATGWITANEVTYDSTTGRWYDISDDRVWPDPRYHTCKHMIGKPTYYYRGGWGRSPEWRDILWVRVSFAQLYRSPLISQDDLTLCALLDEDDPKYQAFVAFAALGGT